MRFPSWITAAPALASALALAVSVSPGAAPRCEWAPPRCIDFASLNGKTLVVPANTSAIAVDGLSACPGEFYAPKGAADIIFVMDNSASMESGETYPIKTKPGDPYGIRDKVIRRAIRAERAAAVSATAGFISFQGITVNENHNDILWKNEKDKIQHPLDISLTNPMGTINLDTLLARVWKHNPAEALLPKIAATRHATVTFWSEPLQLAQAWMSPDSAFVKSSNHAIVLLSDGAIDDSAKVTAFAAALPPVYGIHIGDSSEASNLRDLCARQHGRFALVDPEDTAAFFHSVEDVIAAITANPWPSIIVQVESATSRSLDSTSLASAAADGSLGARLSHVMSLGPGRNAITVTVLAAGAAAKTYGFVLAATGPQVSQSTGDIACAEETSVLPQVRSAAPAFGNPGAQIRDALGRKLGKRPGALTAFAIAPPPR